MSKIESSGSTPLLISLLSEDELKQKITQLVNKYSQLGNHKEKERCLELAFSYELSMSNPSAVKPNNRITDYLGDAKTETQQNGYSERAIELYEQASLYGSTIASYYLARCYYYGWGVAENKEFANKLFEKVLPELEKKPAVRIFVDEQIAVAKCYQKGWGTKIDEKRAVELYQRVADQDDASAQVAL